jgi:hypothetical protein
VVENDPITPTAAEVQPTATLTELASRIRHELKAGKTADEKALDFRTRAQQKAEERDTHYRALGALLMQAKALCKERGENWGEWLEKNTDIDPRMARRYMAFAKGESDTVSGSAHDQDDRRRQDRQREREEDEGEEVEGEGLDEERGEEQGEEQDEESGSPARAKQPQRTYDPETLRRVSEGAGRWLEEAGGLPVLGVGDGPDAKYLRTVIFELHLGKDQREALARVIEALGDKAMRAAFQVIADSPRVLKVVRQALNLPPEELRKLRGACV